MQEDVMPDYLQRESNKITIANFFEDYQLDKYNFNPPYQRRSLWTEEKKSFLIDSILKNYPIPPIFLHQKIDDTTGKTTYDVIDGKQRLTAIVEFINNLIPVADESGELFSDNQIAGSFFKDFDQPEFSQYKSRFWRYIIPVEYVDTGVQEVIDSIFDRLNRNGEPLTGQELRHSNYYGTPLLGLLEDFSKDTFWKARLENVDRNRMEDIEFLSELAFLVLEGHELHANQLELDTLYEKYANNPDVNYDELRTNLIDITKYMQIFEIPYEEWRVGGVSHLYGLFSFCHYCIKHGVSISGIIPRIIDFFNKWRAKQYDQPQIKKYKDSMSARTKDRGQRERRRSALVEFCIQ
jgi:hypothetical protein